MVFVEPGNNGREIELQSVVQTEYGDQMESVIKDVLDELGVDDIYIKIVDHGRTGLCFECTYRNGCASRRGGEGWRRTMLFLPGNSPNMVLNGAVLGSDSIIFDLEDAVSPEQKDAARILVRNVLKHGNFEGCEVIVRINALDTPYWEDDVEAIVTAEAGHDHAITKVSGAD